jgi:hypothetical protein
VEARTPRTNDRGVGEDGNRSSFKSVTLSHYMCRFAKVTEVLPPLYLHILSSGDFVLGLGSLSATRRCCLRRLLPASPSGVSPSG